MQLVSARHKDYNTLCNKFQQDTDRQREFDRNSSQSAAMLLRNCCHRQRAAEDADWPSLADNDSDWLSAADDDSDWFFAASDCAAELEPTHRTFDEFALWDSDQLYVVSK